MITVEKITDTTFSVTVESYNKRCKLVVEIWKQFAKNLIVSKK